MLNSPAVLETGRDYDADAAVDGSGALLVWVTETRLLVNLTEEDLNGIFHPSVISSYFADPPAPADVVALWPCLPVLEVCNGGPFHRTNIIVS